MTMLLTCYIVILDEISAVDPLSTESVLNFSDDAFTTRMWRLRLCCDGISTRLSFKNVGGALYSVRTLMATMKSHAQGQPKMLQLRKSLLRLQELSEDVAGDESEPTHVEVSRFSRLSELLTCHSPSARPLRG